MLQSLTMGENDDNMRMEINESRRSNKSVAKWWSVIYQKKSLVKYK